MTAVEDDSSTLSKMTNADYYVWDSRIMFQGDGLLHTANLECRKNRFDLDTEVKVTNNYVVGKVDEKDTDISVSFFSFENHEIIKSLETPFQIIEFKLPVRDINDVHRDKLVQALKYMGFDYTNDHLTVTLSTECEHFVSSTDSLFEAKSATSGKVPKLNAKAALVNGRHKFIALRVLECPGCQYGLSLGVLREIRSKPQSDVPMFTWKLVS